MLEELTIEQQNLLPKHRDYWIDIALKINDGDQDIRECVKYLASYAGASLSNKDIYIYDSLDACMSAMRDFGIEYDSRAVIKPNSDFYWLSSYHYYKNETDVEISENIIKKLAETKECYERVDLCFLYEEKAFISRKPIEYKWEEREDGKFLHSEIDMVIKYRDDSGVCSWHGQHVPDVWVLDKDNVDPSLALTYKNVDKRRCLAEILGWENVLKQLNARVIDKHSDDQIGELVVADLPDWGPIRFLRAFDPAARSWIAIPCDDACSTAIEAQAWSYGLPVEQFNPDFRT